MEILTKSINSDGKVKTIKGEVLSVWAKRNLLRRSGSEENKTNNYGSTAYFMQADVLFVFAPQAGKSPEVKDNFWEKFDTELFFPVCGV